MADPVLHGVPGGGEMWRIADKTYIVYNIPDADPPVYLRWLVPNEEVAAIFGPDVTPTYTRVLSREQSRSLGMLDFGVSTELANFDDDPFLTWAQTMETQAAVQPWILEDDYQSLIAMAMLEGRTLTEAEIQSTEWWQTHNQAQREWMKLYHGDAEEAEQRIEDNRIRAFNTLREAGIEEPTDAMINYMGDQVTKGNWSLSYFQQQARAASDPYSGIDLDSGLKKIIGTAQPGTTQDQTDEVRSMVRTWLGPVHGDWADTQIQKWAGTLRNDPDGQTALLEHLRKQRLALFPQFEDESLTYEDIASPWRTFGTQMWGQQMDETDPLFATMIRNNDAGVNGTLLRQEGMKRNITTVRQSLREGLLTAGGSSVRQAL